MAKYAHIEQLAMAAGVTPAEIEALLAQGGASTKMLFGRKVVELAVAQRILKSVTGETVPLPKGATVTAAAALGVKGATAPTPTPAAVLPSDRMALGGGVVGAAPRSFAPGPPSPFYTPPGMYAAEGGFPAPIPGQSSNVMGAGLPFAGAAETPAPAPPPRPLAADVLGAATESGKPLARDVVGGQGEAPSGIGSKIGKFFRDLWGGGKKAAGGAVPTGGPPKELGFFKKQFGMKGGNLLLSIFVWHMLSQIMGGVGQDIATSGASGSKNRMLEAQLELQKVLGGGGAAQPSFQDMVVQAMSGPAQMQQQANIGRRAQQPQTGMMWQ